MNARLIPLVALTLLVACSESIPPSARVPTVYVSAVTLVSPEIQRRFTAVVAPRVESEVGLRAGGKLVERLVDVGQSVRQGQTLARLDPSDLTLGAQVAGEQLRAAEVEARQAVNDAARFVRLTADESIPAADAERQQARADAAQARLLQARRQAELAENRAGYATLTAPFDGIVTAVRVEPGQVLAEGQPAFAIARLGELELAVDIPEALSANLSRHEARAVDAEGNPTALRLRELSPSANPVTRTFRARYVPMGRPPDAWRIGMTAEVRLQSTRAAAPIAVLPVGAIVRTTGETHVWVVPEIAAGTLRSRAVELVDQGVDRVHVRGLQAGELVVSAGAQKLDAAMRVRPVARPLDPPLSASTVAPLKQDQRGTR